MTEKRYFVVFCLPRSGSAWLSTFLTGRDSFCFHDSLIDGGWLERMQRRPESVVGVVDTSAYRFASEVRRLMPLGTDYYCIDRNPDEIQAASHRFGVDFDAHEEYGRLANETEGMEVIDYHRFGSAAYMRALWTQMIGQPFDADRAGQIMEMNVQRDVSKFFRARPHLRFTELRAQ